MYRDQSLKDTRLLQSLYRDQSFKDTSLLQSLYRDQSLKDTRLLQSLYRDQSFKDTSLLQSLYRDQSLKDISLLQSLYRDQSLKNISLLQSLYGDQSLKNISLLQCLYRDRSLQSPWSRSGSLSSDQVKWVWVFANLVTTSGCCKVLSISSHQTNQLNILLLKRLISAIWRHKIEKKTRFILRNTLKILVSFLYLPNYDDKVM